MWAVPVGFGQNAFLLFLVGAADDDDDVMY
jgi:hypothetical protein